MWLTCCLLLVFGWATIIHGFERSHDQLLNIVVILLDDVGWGDFGMNGEPSRETVNVDYYARQGMIFTDLYSANPLCSPSRAALLTGRLPVRNGFYTTNAPGRNAYCPQNIVGGISANETLIPELIRTKGYRSKIIGKWHLGHQFQYLPLQHGFDEFFGSTNVHFGPYDDKEMPNVPMFRGNDMIGRVYEEFPIDQTDHTGNITQLYKIDAIEFIKRNAATSTPFFLYFAPDSTHGPTYKAKEFAGKSRRDCSYGDSLLEVDAVVGEIMQTIENTESIAKNTFVFFSSDNGAARQSGIEGGSNFPFLCGKETTFEGGVREPAFAWWPGRIEAGTTNRGPATLMDLFPTVLELAGVDAPSDRVYDSSSLTSALFNNTEDKSKPIYYWRGDRLMAVRQGDYKGHFWAWANGHDEYDVGIDFCVGQNVESLTTRVPQNYTTHPKVINLARDSGEIHILDDRSSEYKRVAPELIKLYNEHLNTMTWGEPALNECDPAVMNWSPPGCEKINKCLPIPKSNKTKCDWPH